MEAGGAGNPQGFVKLSKEYAELSPVVEAIAALRKAEREAAELETLMTDSAADAEMSALAREELEALRGRLPGMEGRLKLMLIRMYQRYAEGHRWKFEALQYSDTGIGGVKEAQAVIAGRGVFARLKFESGVHRVQRVPATEASGRIHTSAATVAVLPEA